MIPLFRILLAGSLVKVLMETERPGLCAGFYAAGAFVLGLAQFRSVTPLLVFTAISFGTAWAFYALVNRIPDNSMWWWVIVLSGVPVLGLL